MHELVARLPGEPWQGRLADCTGDKAAEWKQSIWVVPDGNLPGKGSRTQYIN
jgi:hypothetical protein